jgi:hypothetical protein
MNLFRLEEHVRRWADFKPESTDGIKPVRAMGRFPARRGLAPRSPDD